MTQYEVQPQSQYGKYSQIVCELYT